MTRLAILVSLALHTALAVVLAARPWLRVPPGGPDTGSRDRRSAAFFAAELLGEREAPLAAPAAPALPPEWEPAAPSPGPAAVVSSNLLLNPATLAVPPALPGAPAASPGRLEPKIGDPRPGRRGLAGTKGAASPSVAGYLAPQFLVHPPPSYPAEARARGWEGVAQLLLAVDASGKVVRAQLLRSSGYGVLDRAALETAREWRFIPARQAGLPVASRVEVPVRFRHENKGA